MAKGGGCESELGKLAKRFGLKIMLVAGLLFSFVQVGFAQTNNYVSAIDGSQAWGLVGGSIYRTPDGGQTWESLPGTLVQVSAADYNTAWGVNSADGIFRTANGGQTWESVPGALKYVSALDYNTAWGVNSADMLWRTLDGGLNWENTTGGLRQVTAVDYNTAWGVSADEQLWRTLDGGQTWTNIVIGQQVAVTPPEADTNNAAQHSTVSDAGSNVGRVEFGTGDGTLLGSYEQTGTTSWVEKDASGNIVFYFDETNRDANGVYLFDSSRGVSITLDLPRNMVAYSDSTGAAFDLYLITGVSQKDLSASSAPDITLNITRVEVGTGDGTVVGFYEKTDATTWVEKDVAGNSFSFTEVKRDGKSIDLVDNSRNISLSLDLARNIASYSDNSSNSPSLILTIMNNGNTSQTPTENAAAAIVGDTSGQPATLSFTLGNASFVVTEEDDGSTTPAIYGTITLEHWKGQTLLESFQVFSRTEAAGARVIAAANDVIRVGETYTITVPTEELTQHFVRLSADLWDYDASSANDALGNTHQDLLLQGLIGTSNLSLELTGEGKVVVSASVGETVDIDGNKRFDQMTWLTTHNSFTNYSDARWSMANQTWGITTQLNDGVRGLMLDVWDFGGTNGFICGISFGSDCYPSGVYLCHGGCSTFPGFTYALPRQLFTDTLNEIATWLDSNTDIDDVITIFLEDYTTAQSLSDAIAASNIKSYIYNPNNIEWNVKTRGWPTLEWMKENNKRVIIFTSKRENENAWGVITQWDFTVENYWSIGGSGDNYECTSRNSTPLNQTETNWNRLFVMNHFRNAPTVGLAHYDNGLENLNERWNDYCKPQLPAGRLPNYLAVDFYHLGSAKDFVAQRNQEWQ